MKMEINGKEYGVHFGIRFLRALDEKYFYDDGRHHFGAGIELRVGALLTGDCLALSEILYLGTIAEDDRPKASDVDAYIDGVEDIDALFEEVIDLLKKENATKLKVAKLMENLQKTETVTSKKGARKPTSI